MIAQSTNAFRKQICSSKKGLAACFVHQHSFVDRTHPLDARDIRRGIAFLDDDTVRQNRVRDHGETLGFE